MYFFEDAKPLFTNDIETNDLLRLSLSAKRIKPKKIRIRQKKLRYILLLMIASLIHILVINPKLKTLAIKFLVKNKKFFPVWLKIFVKNARSFNLLDIPVDSNELYELNPEHPWSLDRGFGIPTSSKPEVSIIIPVHNHILTTLTLLQKLRLNTDLVKFEIVVVDDASLDDTKLILSKIRGIKVLTQVKNLGYLRATNSAIKYCEGKYICLLNNDTIPESGWLDALVRTLRSDSKIAIAGSMLMSADGLVSEAGSQIFRNRQIWNLGRGSERGDELFNFTREVDYCSAAAILVDAKFLKSLNGFDERFTPAYYEDTDLAMTAWSQERKVVFVHDSYVRHIEGVSHGKDTSQGFKKYQLVNQEKFWDKWSKTITLPWTLDEVPRFEADRDSRGVIVFFDNFIPSMDSNGGASRAYKIIEAMRQLKFHVVVIPAEPTVEILNREKLRRLGVEVYTSYGAALENLKMRENRINCFWVSRVDVAAQVLPRIGIDFPGRPIYFDTVDLHHLRDERNIELFGSSAAIYQNDIKELELEICAKASKVIVVADYEKKYLTEQNSRLSVDTLFMPFISKNNELSVGGKSYILFVGNFRHTPNIDGVQWLIEEILPKVRVSSCDSVQLRIVGSGLPDSVLKKIDGEKIQYLGWHESLEAIYAQAKFVVVPIRYGAGKKGKLAEAIMHNCPVIATTIGVEGYPLENGSEFLLADDSVDFAQAVSTLWNESEFATKMAVAAKAKLLHESSFEVFVDKVAEILDIAR
jgi:GT2 family glycosyltransferase